MRNIFLFLSLILFCSVHSQNTFQRTYGKVPQDYAYAMAKTNDGGFVIAGSTNSYGGSNYFYLFRVDSLGDTLWMRGYALSSILFGYSVQQTSDNGFIVTGNQGAMKTDALGNTMWGFYSSGVQFYSVQQTADGGYILAGTTGSSSSSNGIEIYLIKLNQSGIKQWSRKLGGPGDDISSCIRQTSDGGYILLGSTTSFGAGSTDIYLIKTNMNGDTLWTKTYGGTGAEGGTNGHQTIELTNDGGYIIGSYTGSFGAGGTDAYLLKLNANGDTAWTKTYGGIGAEIIYSIKQTHDNGYIFSGYTNSFGAGLNDYYLVKTNNTGDTLWSRAFGGTNLDFGQGVVETNDKGFLMAGYTKSFGSGNNDALLIKTDSLGNSPCYQYPAATQVSSQPTVVGTTSTGKVFITLSYTSLNPVIKKGGTIVNICMPSEIHSFEEQNSLLSIYPNPNSGIFHFSLNPIFSEKVKISVTNILGEELYTKVQENNSSVDLSQFCNGTYFIKVEADKIYTKRIIINK